MRKFLFFALILSAPFAYAQAINHSALKTSFEIATKNFKGKVGVCVQDDNGNSCLNGNKRFSMQSTMKLLVAMAILDQVDQHNITLDDSILVKRSDLSVFHQPIAKLVTDAGYKTTIGDLVSRAIIESDSTATDVLIKKLGGIKKVQQFLIHKNITGIRVDRNERNLQTEIFGLKWIPKFINEEEFQKAIDSTPHERREKAYNTYLHDIRDTATPEAMANLLYKLVNGAILSNASTNYIIKTMEQTVTGKTRLSAGIPVDWVLGHKTGTSSVYNGIAAATNDIGILTSPDGKRIAIAVFVGDSTEDEQTREHIIAELAKITVDNYNTDH